VIYLPTVKGAFMHPTSGGPDLSGPLSQRLSGQLSAPLSGRVDDVPRRMSGTIGGTISAVDESTARLAALSTGVRSGRVVIDPAEGRKLQAALWEQAERAGEWRERARAMARRAPLGHHVVGEAMSRKFVRRADGEPMSLADVLDRYRTRLLDAHAAVGEAMRRYSDDDEAHAAMFRRIDAS
jgi:hypothetical protein